MKMNSVKIELDIGGRKFSLSYDAPDAVGQISATDLNLGWLDDHLRVALRPISGRLVLQNRSELVAVTPPVVKHKHTAGAGAL